MTQIRDPIYSKEIILPRYYNSLIPLRKTCVYPYTTPTPPNLSHPLEIIILPQAIHIGSQFFTKYPQTSSC